MINGYRNHPVGKATLAVFHRPLAIIGGCLTLTVITIFRFGFRVHTSSDNYFFLTYWLKALNRWHSTTDLLNLLQYDHKTIWFVLWKPFFAAFDLQLASFILVVLHLLMYFLGCIYLSRLVGVKTILGFTLVLLFVSNIGFSVGGPPVVILDATITPRQSSLVFLIWGVVLYLRRNHFFSGVGVGVAVAIHAPTAIIVLCGLGAYHILATIHHERDGNGLGMFVAGLAIPVAYLSYLYISQEYATTMSYFRPSEAWLSVLYWRLSYLLLANWGLASWISLAFLFVVLPAVIFLNRSKIRRELLRFTIVLYLVAVFLFVAITVFAQVFLVPTAFLLKPSMGVRFLQLFLWIVLVVIIEGWLIQKEDSYFDAVFVALLGPAIVIMGVRVLAGVISVVALSCRFLKNDVQLLKTKAIPKLASTVFRLFDSPAGMVGVVGISVHLLFVLLLGLLAIFRGQGISGVATAVGSLYAFVMSLFVACSAVWLRKTSLLSWPVLVTGLLFSFIFMVAGLDVVVARKALWRGRVFGEHAFEVEPAFQGTPRPVDPRTYNSYPRFPLGRVSIFHYIKQYSGLSDNVAFSYTQGATFYDAREWTERGVFWDMRLGGSLYYSSDEFISSWIERRKVNDTFFAFPENFVPNGEYEDWLSKYKERYNRYKIWFKAQSVVNATNPEFEAAAKTMYSEDVRWIIVDGPFPRKHPFVKKVLEVDGFYLYRLDISAQDIGSTTESLVTDLHTVECREVPVKARSKVFSLTGC